VAAWVGQEQSMNDTIKLAEPEKPYKTLAVISYTKRVKRLQHAFCAFAGVVAAVGMYSGCLSVRPELC